MEKMCYTYLLAWSKQNVAYYGVRYAKGCHPDELMKTYLTSSKYVKQALKEFGMPDVIEIRKTFGNNDKKARSWEAKVLRRLKVIRKSNWLNKNDSVAICPIAVSKAQTERWELIPHEERILLMNKVRSFIPPEQIKQNASKAGKISMSRLSVEERSARGKHAAEIVNKRMSRKERSERGKKGMKSRWDNTPADIRSINATKLALSIPMATCSVCGTTSRKNQITRFHNENCKSQLFR